jgi:PAS domain S-box-containing protein
MKQLLLVIDDDENMVGLISDICRKHLPEVQMVSAPDGTHGLQLAQSEKPGVVVLDVNLHDINGFEVCRRLRADPATLNTHILMMSGAKIKAKDRIQGIQNGADGYLFKPFDPQELVLNVRALFRWWAAERAQLEKLEELVDQRTQALAEVNAGLQREMAERNHAEEESLRLATAVKQASECIVITDPQAVIQYVNPAFERITGYTCVEAIGQTPRILKSGSHDAAFYRQLWGTLRRGEVWTGHFINRRKNGMLYEEEGTISSVRNPAGQVTNYVAIKRDVTEEMNLQKQLNQSRKMETVGLLAGGVAHDFNNILQTILGYSEQLLQNTPDTDERHRDLLEIQRSGERAATLTRQLLAFSRKQILMPRIHDLNGIITNLGRMLIRLIGEDMELRLELTPKLNRIKVDAGQIEQVLMNLAVNARDAMPKGGQLVIRTRSIVLQAEDLLRHPEGRPGNFVCMDVTDNGCGMSKEVQARVFEPFFTTKPQGKGTGLGLATVHGIIKQHDGWTTISSAVGLGTTFKIYLPAVADPEEVPAPAPAEPAPTGRNERILVIEDEPHVRRLVQLFLSKAGYCVTAVGTCVEAQTVYGNLFDLVLSDVVLPDGNGLEMARHFEHQRPDLRCVLISGYADIHERWPEIEKHGWVFLHKPFSRTDLLRAVATALART